MTIRWEESYLGQLRQLVGNRMVIAPAVRAIIQDTDERILFVRRRDNGAWVMPAGGMELHESIFDCLKREVKEETGLDVLDATPIAMYTGPKYEYTNMYGAENKMFSIVFLVDGWQGKLVTFTDETTDARFYALDELPDVPELYRETIKDLVNFRQTGKVILK